MPSSSFIILQKPISFGLYACPVSFAVIGGEHPGRKELVCRAVLWKDVAKQFGQPVTRLLVTTLTATEGQFSDVILYQNHPMMQSVSFVKLMQVNSDSSVYLVTDAVLWIPWCNQKNFSLAFIAKFISLITNSKSTKRRESVYNQGTNLLRRTDTFQ